VWYTRDHRDYNWVGSLQHECSASAKFVSPSYLLITCLSVVVEFLIGYSPLLAIRTFYRAGATTASREGRVTTVAHGPSHRGERGRAMGEKMDGRDRLREDMELVICVLRVSTGRVVTRVHEARLSATTRKHTRGDT
jgi:hypothetical protein